METQLTSSIERPPKPYREENPSHYNLVSCRMSKTDTHTKTVEANQNSYLNEACDSEKAARSFARSLKTNKEVSIIYSPHDDNKHGDYFVTNDSGFIRTWETEIYSGPANKA